MNKNKCCRRETPQRTAIYNYLINIKIHPNAENVFQAVASDFPNLTLATVYRNLNLMADQGRILRFKVNNEFRFDADITNHQHGICDCCNKVFDFLNEKISKYALKKFDGCDFKPKTVNIFYHGICKKCLCAEKEVKTKQQNYQ